MTRLRRLRLSTTSPLRGTEPPTSPCCRLGVTTPTLKWPQVARTLATSGYPRAVHHEGRPAVSSRPVELVRGLHSGSQRQCSSHSVRSRPLESPAAPGGVSHEGIFSRLLARPVRLSNVTGERRRGPALQGHQTHERPPEGEYPSGSAPAPPVTLGDLAGSFLRLGSTAFGGPAAHLAFMRGELVVRGAGSATGPPRLHRRREPATGTDLDRSRPDVGPPPKGWRGARRRGAVSSSRRCWLVLALSWAYVRYGATDVGAGRVCTVSSPSLSRSSRTPFWDWRGRRLGLG